MNITFTNISIDTIIQAISILGAALTFVIAQSIEKKRDRKLANREVYQQLEFASIDLFRFEADNIELIRPIWEEGKEIPEKGTAEYIVLMNYVCQMLNLFEMALKFRKDKILLPEVFGSWIAWFQLLVTSPGFHFIWDDIRMDYLTELREIMDGGLELAIQEPDETQFEAKFYQFTASVLKCKSILEYVNLGEENNRISHDDKIIRNLPNKENKIDSSQVLNRWVQDVNDIETLTTLFIENSRKNYISHSEIQEGRAINEEQWSDNLSTILTKEFTSAIENDLFSEANIAAAYINKKIVGFILLEYEDSPEGRYAILSDIIVDKNYRKNRIGENLIHWVLPQLKNNNLNTLFAESNINNHPAHKFLEKIDFKEVSKVFRKSF